MLYKKDKNSVEGVEIKQVNKNVAERAFMEGLDVWMHPCDLPIDNILQEPKLHNKKNINKPFEILIEEFKKENCDVERGKRVTFFIEKK